MALDPGEGRGEAAERDAGDEERRAEPERVDGEEERGASEVAALRGEVEDRSEDRADAGSPSQPERGPGDRGRERAEALQVRMEPELLVEAWGREELGAGEVRGHEEDAAPRDPGEGVLGPEDGFARRRR